MAVVQCVFVLSPDGDGYTTYDLIGVADSRASAAWIVRRHKLVPASTKAVAHPSMTAATDWIHYGKRSDCTSMVDFYPVSIWGYVVEEMVVEN